MGDSWEEHLDACHEAYRRQFAVEDNDGNNEESGKEDERENINVNDEEILLLNSATT